MAKRYNLYFTNVDKGNEISKEQYFYNGMEQRVRKIEGSTTTKYIYAGSELLFTTDVNNAKLTENVLSIVINKLHKLTT